MIDPMQKGTILCIDDDEGIRLVVSDYLETDGYKVLTAESMQQALEKADAHTPDVRALEKVVHRTIFYERVGVCVAVYCLCASHPLGWFYNGSRRR